MRRPSRPAPTSSTTSRSRRSALVLVALALAGCGGSHHRAAGPPLASICPGTLSATTSWLRTSDGVRIFAAEAGSGSTAFVLAHESGGMCGWLPTMRYLAAHGMRGLMFAFRGYPPSDSPPMSKYNDLGPDLQAAVDAAHHDGAKKVVVMGASMGGAAAITFGHTLHGVDGIVNLSGELNLPGRALDTFAEAPKLRTPLLVVASRDDPYLDATDATKLFSAAGSTDKKLVLLAGAYHGWDLLNLSPRRAHVWSSILAWVAAH